jgi:hypothetical protein
MSDGMKERKYKFESKIRLPNMQEILDAASDFTAPSEKALEVAKDPQKKPSIKDLAKKADLSPDLKELQQMSQEVADAEVRRAKEKELQRAEELRRLCREREEAAQAKAQEEQKIADEEKKKAIQAARDKAQARKDAEAEAAAASEAAATAVKKNDTSALDALFQLPSIESIKQPDFGKSVGSAAESAFEENPTKEEPEKTEVSAKAEEPAVAPASSVEELKDISEIAMNPFAEDAMKYRPVKKKEEFKETILKEDYTEEMDLRADTSESVDDDFLDFDF